jgi:hypothetical protein
MMHLPAAGRLQVWRVLALLAALRQAPHVQTWVLVLTVMVSQWLSPHERGQLFLGPSYGAQQDARLLGSEKIPPSGGKKRSHRFSSTAA